MMPQTTPPPVGLCVQDLTVRYGTVAVLQGVSFSVPVSGQLIGLVQKLPLPWEREPVGLSACPEE